MESVQQTGQNKDQQRSSNHNCPQRSIARCYDGNLGACFGKQRLPIEGLQKLSHRRFFVLANGLPWMALREKYGKWQSVCSKLRRWTIKGVMHELFEQIKTWAPGFDVEYIMIDSIAFRRRKSAMGPRAEAKASAESPAVRQRRFTLFLIRA